MLLRRAIPPGFGAWAQPGGFLEADETVIQGAVRETLEETGLVVEPDRIVGIYSRPQAAIVVIAYQATIVGGAMTVTRESLEVRPFSAEAIPWAGLAFCTTSGPCATGSAPCAPIWTRTPPALGSPEG